MAIIWFLKEGEVQGAFPIAEKSLDWCVKTIGLRPENWRADVATKKLTIAQQTRTHPGTQRPFGYVIVEIGEDDLAKNSVSKEWKQGFHLLDSDEIEPGKILER